MAFTVPSVADFKAYFVRDFPYGITPSTVNDSDITNAIAEAGVNFNEGLFGSQANFTLCYLLLSAHMMVMSLRGSSQGIAGQYSWLQASKSVGSVAESFSIPQKILDNPYFAMLCKTSYGARYLSLMLPKMVGQTFIAYGETQA